MMKVTAVREPKSFAETALDSRWMEAIKEEMQALDKNKTLNLFHIHPTQESYMVVGGYTRWSTKPDP